FDGVCNLCNGAVQFIIKRDPTASIKFAPLQSNRGKAELQKFGMDQDYLHSIIVIDNDQLYSNSAAAIRIAKKLGGIWSFFSVFNLVPKSWRDGLYNLIARNRYRFFGKQKECMLPTPELKSRFLDQ